MVPCFFFVDVISDLTAVPAQGATAPTGENYTFSNSGIAWSSDRTKYGKSGYTNLATIVPPEKWCYRFPNCTYTVDFPPPDITTDEHFQVWMRTAGWPTFLKAYGRNDNTVLKQGTYQMTVDMSKRTLENELPEPFFLSVSTRTNWRLIALFL